MKTFFATAFILITSGFFQNSETVFKGEWERESRWTTFEGTWKILKEGDNYFVEMGDDFEAKKAPDLKIFLSKSPLGEISGKNATTKGTPVLVAKLNAYEGKARYAIPASINVNDYATIIVHCEEYAKLWGGSSLK